MPTLVVDPAQYAHAAESMTSVAHSAHSAASSLGGELGASSGMAGSDNAGTAWADGYDQGARAALSAAASAVGAVGNIATRLHATGENHAHADASSVIGGGGDGSLDAAPTPPTMSAPSVPSSAGGSGGGPPGWSLVEGLVGYVWPNGHQDRLHAADAAWRAAAAQLQDAAGPTSTAASAVSAQQSPESAAAAQACTDTGSHLRELSSVFTELGSSCSEYAAHLDQAHHEIIHELEVLLAQTVAIEAVSAIAGFFTAGIGELAGQAVETARLTAAAAKIRGIIEALIAAARAVAASIGRVAGRAGELLSKLKPMEEGAVTRARPYEFDMVNKPGPLADARFGDSPPAANFAGGRYNAETLQGPQTFYRGGDEGHEFGRWFTDEPPQSVAHVRIDTAVKPQWIDAQTGEFQGASPVTTAYEIELPEGTTIYRGPVANQGGVYVGGAEQVYVEAPWKGGKVIGSWPLK